jgi:hypothetical protein
MVQPFNESEPATLRGIEAGIQKYADFLPSPFDGLGMDVNYTFIDSKQPGALAYDMQGKRINGLPMTGLSRHTFNVAMMYDKGRSRCASPTTGAARSWFRPQPTRPRAPTITSTICRR